MADTHHLRCVRFTMAFPSPARQVPECYLYLMTVVPFQNLSSSSVNLTFDYIVWVQGVILKQATKNHLSQAYNVIEGFPALHFFLPSFYFLFCFVRSSFLSSSLLLLITE
jgi:hypothetical protein